MVKSDHHFNSEHSRTVFAGAKSSLETKDVKDYCLKFNKLKIFLYSPNFYKSKSAPNTRLSNKKQRILKSDIKNKNISAFSSSTVDRDIIHRSTKRDERASEPRIFEMNNLLKGIDLSSYNSKSEYGLIPYETDTKINFFERSKESKNISNAIALGSTWNSPLDDYSRSVISFESIIRNKSLPKSIRGEQTTQKKFKNTTILTNSTVTIKIAIRDNSGSPHNGSTAALNIRNQNLSIERIDEENIEESNFNSHSLLSLLNKNCDDSSTILETSFRDTSKTDNCAFINKANQQSPLQSNERQYEYFTPHNNLRTINENTENFMSLKYKIFSSINSSSSESTLNLYKKQLKSENSDLVIKPITPIHNTKDLNLALVRFSRDYIYSETNSLNDLSCDNSSPKLLNVDNTNLKLCNSNIKERNDNIEESPYPYSTPRSKCGNQSDMNKLFNELIQSSSPIYNHLQKKTFSLLDNLSWSPQTWTGIDIEKNHMKTCLDESSSIDKLNDLKTPFYNYENFNGKQIYDRGKNSDTPILSPGIPDSSKNVKQLYTERGCFSRSLLNTPCRFYYEPTIHQAPNADSSIKHRVNENKSNFIENNIIEQKQPRIKRNFSKIVNNYEDYNSKPSSNNQDFMTRELERKKSYDSNNMLNIERDHNNSYKTLKGYNMSRNSRFN